MLALALGTLWGAGWSEGRELSFRTQAAVPRTLTAGARIEVTVRLTNDGRAAWTPEAPIRLAYHWLDPDTNPVVWDGDRTALPLPVVPGQTVEVKARVRAPDHPGHYRFQWDLVEEGHCWFSQEMSSPPVTVPVVVQPAPRDHAFELVAASWPLVMPDGGERSVRVTIRNTGDLPWAKGRRINLSYHWLNGKGRVIVQDGERTDVPLPVSPGGTVTLEARLRAPGRAGVLYLQWDVVEEQVCWFSQCMKTPPPSRRVVVFASMPLSLALLAVLLLVVRSRLRRAPQDRGGPLALADVAWFTAAVLIKQAWVMAQAPPLPGEQTFLLAASPVFFLALLALLLPGRLRPWVLLGTGTLLSLLFWSDVVYMRYFQGLPSFALLGAAGQTGAVTESIRALIHRSDLWLLLDLPAAALLTPFVAKRHTSRKLRVAAAVVLLVGTIPFAAWIVRSTTATKGGDVQRFSGLQLGRRIGITGYHLVDAWDQIKEAFWSTTVTDTQVQQVARLLEERRPWREGAGPLFGSGRGMNVILLQVESLQGFMVNLDVGGVPVMPTLRKLAQESVAFEQCTDQTAYGRTSDAELLSETSLLPAEHGAACFSHGDDRFVGLARVLGRQGYATLSAVPFLGRFWNRRVTHRAFGFAHNLFARDFQPGRTIGWGLNDRDFLSQMLDRLDGLPQPFLAYMITLSLHHPFEGFPRDLEVMDAGRWEGTPFGGYIHAMHFFDTALAAFLDGLEERGLAGNTILVVWGDHDAGFPWTLDMAEAEGHPHTELAWILADRVPLIIHIPGPDAPHGLSIRTPVGLWDVAPTVAALAGVDPGPLPWLGRNLARGADKGPLVRPNGGWIDGSLLWTGEETGRCYDWRAGRRLEPEACADGTAAARRIAGASDLILKADLQHRLEALLAGEGR